MISNHTASIEIKHGINTQGFFSFENADNLIVFVHGFAGKSLETWNDFPTMMLLNERFKKSDIIFYGYDTFKGQAGDHASRLYHFLKLCMQPLSNQILPKTQALPERNYSRIMLVAHSLGAILIRQAQLLAFIDNQTWIKNSEMVLYAPAHHGAQVTTLANQALSGGLFGFVKLFLTYRYPVYNDLTPGSTLLNHIASKTQKLQEEGNDFTKAKLVVYAMGDTVVQNIQYLLDKPAQVISDTTHVAVCKPKDGFVVPFELLCNLLEAN